MDFTSSLILTFIGFFPFPESEIYSDYTARGGETRVSVTRDEKGARLQGNLLGIIGQSGKRVGFVGIRTPTALSDVSDLNVFVEGVKDLKVRAVFTTLNRNLPTLDGELSYQTILIPTNVSNVYKIDLKNLIPTTRGRNLSISKVPPFRNEDVTHFAVEVKLSEQVFDQEEGLDFNFKVLWR